MSNGVEMPKYRSHKEVWALKIKRVEADFAEDATDTGSLFFDGDGFAPLEVSREYLRKHKPLAGGYFVVYKGGYQSWSPADAFEGGYTRITP